MTLAGFGLAALVAACDPGGGAAAAGQEASRDSAGITIIESAESRWRSGEEWRIDPRATLSIGVQDGPDPYILTNVSAGTVLGDGTVAVAENARSAPAIRFFGPDGAFRSAIGRHGAGPGEFRSLQRLFRIGGDTLLAYDAQLQRVTLFGPGGTLVRTHQLLAAGGLRSVVDVVDGGRLVVSGSPSAGSSVSAGTSRGSVTYGVHDLAAGRTDTVTTAPFLAQFSVIEGNLTRNYVAPFSGSSYITAGPGRVWIGVSDLNEIRAYDVPIAPAATERSTEPPPTLIIRGSRPMIAVTGEHRSRHEVLVLASAGAGRARMERDLRRMEYPDSMPAFQDLIADRLGNLWVLRYEPPWAEGDQLWDVHDSHGRWLGAVTIPESLLSNCSRRPGIPCRTILEIGDDYILMRQWDAHGVERVHRYHLIKGQEATGQPR